MITSKLYDELLISISYNKVANYLIYQGWCKEDEIEGEISFWSKRVKNEKIIILLPINREFADFEDKIEDLLNILSKVEERPKEEILKVLGSTSIIAKENGREIIDLKVELADRNKHDISAKSIGMVLKSLEDFFVSIGDSLAKNLTKQVEKHAAHSAVEFSLIETFHGSFGLRMGLGKNQGQLNLLEPTTAEKAAEDFINLVKASNQGSSEALKSEIQKHRGESPIRFRALIQYLKNLESDLFLEWGSVNPKKGGMTKLSFDNIVQALEILKKFELEQDNSVEVIGRLIFAGIGEAKSQRKFLLIDESNRISYEGYISIDMVKDFENNIELDEVYKATIIEEFIVNPVTGEEAKKYTLTKLERIIKESSQSKIVDGATIEIVSIQDKRHES